MIATALASVAQAVLRRALAQMHYRALAIACKRAFPSGKVEDASRHEAVDSDSMETPFMSDSGSEG